MSLPPQRATKPMRHCYDSFTRKGLGWAYVDCPFCWATVEICRNFFARHGKWCACGAKLTTTTATKLK